MRSGTILQVGTPTKFMNIQTVSTWQTFIGNANFLKVLSQLCDDQMVMQDEEQGLPSKLGQHPMRPEGATIMASIRPEKINITKIILDLHLIGFEGS